MKDLLIFQFKLNIFIVCCMRADMLHYIEVFYHLLITNFYVEYSLIRIFKVHLIKRLAI